MLDSALVIANKTKLAKKKTLHHETQNTGTLVDVSSKVVSVRQ